MTTLYVLGSIIEVGAKVAVDVATVGGLAIVVGVAYDEAGKARAWARGWRR